MEQILAGTTTRPRFYAVLLSVFGAIAGFIAVVGLYGVLAYLVGQRTKELGIRMALGAKQSAVLRLVLRRGAAMVAIGIGAGLAGALALDTLSRRNVVRPDAARRWLPTLSSPQHSRPSRYLPRTCRRGAPRASILLRRCGTSNSGRKQP